MEKNQRNIEPGTPVAGGSYSLIIDTKGPYFVYGTPPFRQEIIEPDEEGEAWNYKEGITFQPDSEPIAICRCGHSASKPYCDGAHTQAEWDPTLTADHKPLLEDANVYDGPRLELTDNPKYCIHARFCMAKGSVWKLMKKSGQEEVEKLAIHETFFCPSGRLKLADKVTGNFLEPEHSPSISILEDPQMNCSGPLWVKGGIPIEDSECHPYEVRNRVTLCRCGFSSNKPFCDGAHMKSGFQDGLEQTANPTINPSNTPV